MRAELYGYAIDIARGLGDVRGAQLMQMAPQSVLYATGLEGDVLVRGRQALALRPGTADGLRARIVADAVSCGLDGERMADRLGAGAANAREERDWVQSDLLGLSGHRRLDLRDPDQSRKAVKELQGFYDRAAGLIDHVRRHEAVPEDDRLVRTLRAMGRLVQVDGKVGFRNDDHAERFAQELRQRYGDGIVPDLAAGRTDALAGDIHDAAERTRIAQAVIAAAKAHVAFGLTLRQAREAERGLPDRPERDNAGGRER